MLKSKRIKKIVKFCKKYCSTNIIVIYLYEYNLKFGLN